MRYSLISTKMQCSNRSGNVKVCRRPAPIWAAGMTIPTTFSQIGSFQRKTKIRPTDLGDGLDIDAVVSFMRFTEYATGSSGVSSSEALEIVRRALTSNETYRVMTPEKDHPVITLQYADDMKIELIPAFVDGAGGLPSRNRSQMLRNRHVLRRMGTRRLRL